MRESSLSLDKALVTGLLQVTGTNLLGLRSCKNARPYGIGMEYIQPYESYLDFTGVYPFPQLLVGEKYQYLATPTGIYEIVAGTLVLKVTQAATTHYDLVDYSDSVVIVGNGKSWVRTSDGTLQELPLAGTAGTRFDGTLLIAVEDRLHWAARPLSVEFEHSTDTNTPTGAGDIKLFCGPILRVFVLEKKVVVFGTKGLVVLAFISDPLPTLGVELEIPITMSGREAVVMSTKGFSFIDSLGLAFAFDLSDTKRLGFQRFFAGKRVIGTFDTEQQEILFCTGTETIVFCSYGAGSRAQVITSGGLISGLFEAIVLDTSSYGMEVVVDTQDMQVSGLKTIYEVPVGYSTDGIVKINNARVGPLGVGTKVISKDSFQPEVSIIALTQAQITSMEVRWKLTDKRYVRGQYGNQATT